MPYAARADLADRYDTSEIEARESMLPAGAVDKAFADAGTEIDGYLARRYPVPLNPVPAAVVRLACDIARYRLLGDSANEDVRGRYKDAVAMLKEIGAGRVLIDAAPLAGGQSAALVEVVGGRSRVFRGAAL